jgi:hypothetical protein
MSDDTIRRVAEKLVKDLADRGLLIAAGWQTYRLLCLKLPAHEPADALHEAFMAGAEHVFASMMNMMEEDREPTAADMHRMTQLHEELEPVRATLKLKYNRAMGSA